MEYSVKCAEDNREKIEKKGRGKLYIGDQANVTFLDTIIEDQAGRVFDVIIDDGTRILKPFATISGRRGPTWGCRAEMACLPSVARPCQALKASTSHACFPSHP